MVQFLHRVRTAKEENQPFIEPDRLQDRTEERLRARMEETIAEYGREKALTEWEVQTLRSDASHVIDVLVSAFGPKVDITTKTGMKRRLPFWTHVSDPMHVIEEGDFPAIDKATLIWAADAYLLLPVRMRELDRLLIDALVAMEIFDFSRELFHELKPPRIGPFLAWVPQSPFSYRSPLSSYVRQLFAVGATVTIIIAILVALAAFQWLGPVTTLVLCLVVIGLGSIPIVVDLFTLPRRQSLFTRTRRRVASLLEQMVRLYTELGQNGTTSAIRIREVASVASQSGAGWPPPLYAILDDAIARGGRL